jgi:hypothetical protein
MDDLTFIKELGELEQRAYKTGIKIQSEIDNDLLDARASTFYFMAIAIRSFKIFLILKKEYLDEQQWYIDVYLSKYKQQWPVAGGRRGQIINDHNVLTNDYFMVMLIGYIQILFSILDSKFRCFLMNLDPNALSRKRDSFYEVYTCLLKRVKKTQYQEFIRFFSLIRNTIHNNGMYVKATKQYDSSEYNGKIYEFKHKEIVNYPGGAPKLLLLQITPDVIDMMEDIILNTELIGIDSIPEPLL